MLRVDEPRRWRVAGALITVALLALGACGSDGDAETTAAESTAIGEDTDVTDDGAAGDSESATEPGGSEETGPDAGTTDPGEDPDGPGAGGEAAALLATDACGLLDAEWLADTVSFEFGESVWEQQADEADPNRCRWFNDSKLLTLSVEVTTEEGADLEGRRAEPTEGTTIEDIDVTPGSFAVRDDFGERWFQLWIPLDDGHVVSVIVDTMHLEDDQFLAVATEVAARASA